MRPAFEGIDTLFLLGATGPKQTYHETNVVAEEVSAGVTQVVKLSVWRAPEQLSRFARLHRRVEIKIEIEATDLESTFLRPNAFMQTFTSRQGESIRTRRMFAQPRMDGAASYIDARDIARVTVKVLTAKAYSLSGPAALTFAEIAGILSGVLGHQVSFVELSDEDATAGMLTAGAPPSLVDYLYLVAVSRAYRSGGLEGTSSAVEESLVRPPRASASSSKITAGS